MSSKISNLPTYHLTHWDTNTSVNWVITDQGDYGPLSVQNPGITWTNDAWMLNFSVICWNKLVISETFFFEENAFENVSHQLLALWFQPQYVGE